MKLLTKTLEKRFAKIGRQADQEDPLVIAKFFNPSGEATWYATEFNPDDRCFFGFVVGLGHDEWGYFSLDELESLRVPPFGLPIERDKWFDEQPFSTLNL